MEINTKNTQESGIVSDISNIQMNGEEIMDNQNLKSDKSCKSCSKEQKFVYAIGSLDAKFSSLSLEREYNQVIAIEDTKGQSDSQLLYKTLKENRYIAREMCWVFSVEGIDTYLLVPKDSLDVDVLVESLNQKNEDEDTNVLIGELGPIAPASMCNGLSLPIVFFDKLYTFSKKQLIDAIPKDSTNEKDFNLSATELFNRIKQIADNIGLSDEHRALNYLSVRYPQIYALVYKMHTDDYSLSKIYVIPSRLYGNQKLLDPIFEFVNRKTSVAQKYYVRIDVTSKYPFVQNALTQFLDRI